MASISQWEEAREKLITLVLQSNFPEEKNEKRCNGMAQKVKNTLERFRLPSGSFLNEKCLSYRGNGLRTKKVVCSSILS